MPDFRVANILRDGKTLIEARADAFSVAEKMSREGAAEDELIRKVLARRWGGRFELTRIG